MSIDHTSKKKRIQLTLRNTLAFALSLLAIFFLVPGIYLSMMTFAGEQRVDVIDAPSLSTTLTLFDTTRSIISTITNLWKQKYYFVSSMIFMFSIAIPVVKSVLLIYSYFCQHPITRRRIFSFIKAVGKWSMCDVFIVAIFLSYLSTGASHGANSKEISVWGLSTIKVVPHVTAQLQMGFWCFLTYCLLSLAALQLYKDK